MVTNAKEITATQFKARVLRVLDEVADTGEPLVITKRGKPVARLEPAAPRPKLLGSAKLNLTDEELVVATMGPWDVEDG
jgi:prevent-host-death family protein